MLAGPPGSGKTTVGRAVADRLDPSVDFETDWYWSILRRGFVEPWRPESEPQNRTVLAAIAASATTLGAGGYHVVLNGILGPWPLDLFTEALAGSGLACHYLVLRPSLEACVARATGRPAPALVDEGPVRQLWAQFGDLGRYESHVIDTTVRSVDETVAVTLERYRAGTALV